MTSSMFASATSKPFEDVRAVARLAQLEDRASRDDLAPMAQERLR